jgi:hypothetical protein
MTELVPGITVVIPTIPPRAQKLQRAVESAYAAGRNFRREAGVEGPFQLDVCIVLDEDREGAARTRQRGLDQVGTEWVAFLDDDDEFLPCHLTEMWRAAQKTGADYLWSRFRIQFPNGQVHDGPQFLGEKAFSQWNDDDPCQTTVTTFVKTELACRAGGFVQVGTDGSQIDGQRRGEDYEFTLRCRMAGGQFWHVPIVTWVWWHHESNTSGLPIW